MVSDNLLVLMSYIQNYFKVKGLSTGFAVDLVICRIKFTGLQRTVFTDLLAQISAFKGFDTVITELPFIVTNQVRIFVLTRGVL